MEQMKQIFYSPYESAFSLKVERKYFKRAGWEFDFNKDSYAALTVLRLLDMKETNPEVWERFQRLEDHNEARREEEPELWEYHERHIVSFITEKLGLKEFSVDEVRGVVGKMFTNCGDLELSPAYARGCGYYPTYANMNHNCRANTKTFKYASDQKLEVRAQEAITCGQEISTQYVTSMKATFARRPVLRAKWYFDCGCDRQGYLQRISELFYTFLSYLSSNRQTQQLKS